LAFWSNFDGINMHILYRKTNTTWKRFLFFVSPEMETQRNLCKVGYASATDLKLGYWWCYLFNCQHWYNVLLSDSACVFSMTIDKLYSLCSFLQWSHDWCSSCQQCLCVMFCSVLIMSINHINKELNHCFCCSEQWYSMRERNYKLCRQKEKLKPKPIFT